MLFCRTTAVVAIAWVSFVAAGCVTQKKKGERSALGKLYENTTARYNGYYNATVLLEESMLTLEQQYQDNYNALLPLYPYMAFDNARAVASQLDEAIKKVSTVVMLHRSSRWTDDCYLLMGKAQFVKRDYESAEETLKYLVEEFPPDNPVQTTAPKKSKPTLAQRKKAVAAAKKARQKTRKAREREIKKQRKVREKERRRRNKEIKRLRKLRKKGKAVPSRTRTQQDKREVPKGNEPSRPTTPDQSKRPQPETTAPVDTSGLIRLGGLGPKPFEGDGQQSPLDKIKHRPAYQEGMLWLARTYIERGRLTEAHRILAQMMESKGTYDDLRKDVALALAWLCLKEDKPADALPWIDEAIARTRRGPERARYYFIKGQLLQRLGRNAEAAAAFEAVTHSGATYEMVFNARLNLARMRWLSREATAEEVIQELERMRKDEKNAEYQDRIYFTMAQIALATDQRAQAVRWLEKSIETNSGDRAQKAESYLLLADLHFEAGNYVEAKSAYDAALQAMDSRHPRHSEVKRLAENLTDIARHLETIALQDSLLAISRMSEAEKLKLARRIRKEQEEARRKALLESTIASSGTINKNNPRAGAATMAGLGGRAVPVSTSSSSFFAYDDRAMRKGLRDFQRVWGERPLVDNWRLANRIKGLTSEQGDLGEEEIAVSVTEEDLSSILADVPDTEEEIQKAHAAIMEAMFKLGGLYRDKLQANEKAVETLEALLRRYPDTPYKLDALYLLYLAYSEMGRRAEAERYKGIIVEQYPNSNYARLLTDPEYARSFLDREKQADKYYEETYALFEQQRYGEVLRRVEEVGPKFGSKHALIPKFALLKAMSKGAVEGREAYVQALKELIGRHPDTPEAVRAREILRLLGEKVGKAPIATTAAKGQTLEDSPFTYEEGKLHYVIVVFEPGVKLTQVKANIADYNSKYHSLEKLRISNIYLGPPTDPTKLPLIVIRRFPNKRKAMDYYEGVMNNRGAFIKEAIEFELYPITQGNYREILKRKSLDGYREFFEAHYLEK